jgi:predicted ATPase
MLQKVSIQNFKSLKDVTLDLQKVNLLIGPNNSGKSNFLKALELWGVITDNKLIDDIASWFKPSDIFQKNNKNNVAFNLTLDKVNPIREDNHALLGIKYGEIPGDTFKVGLYISDFEFYQYFPNKNPQKRSLEKENGSYPIVYYFIDFFKNIKLYKPNPTEIIVPQDLKSVKILNSDCSNLIAFLFTLSIDDEGAFQRIQNDFANCVLDFVRIKTPPINTDDGGKLSLKFFDKEGNDYWADEVSEGVLYFLALLCIVHQPNPPKLLLLEEPEKGIHPRRIHEVMKFIFQLAEDKDIQVIMTSHNEHVLQEFRLNPASVFIFDKDEEGATFVKNLQKDVIEPDTQKAQEFGIEPINYLDNMGESWFMGLMGGVPA